MASARNTLKLSSVLSDEGLESWSHVSEDTKQYLSQVPWIREKVQGQDKDAEALQGAGVWSTSPALDSTNADPQSDDAGSINLEAGIPDFSLRRTDSSGPPKKPIAEVLDDVRDKLKSIKESYKAQRSATFPGVGVLGSGSQTGVDGSLANSTPVQPSIASPETTSSKTFVPKKPPTATENSTTSAGQTKDPQQSQRRHSKNRFSQLSSLRHRDSQSSLDSQLLEIQLFPGEIATEANKEEIKRKLPTSIRARCTYKDGYWWYDGDPGDLSGLTKDGKSERVRAGVGDSSKGSQPIIQKGNVTIAGRPLLIERCFQKHKETWTCEPDANIMKDTPIPLIKDGETVVIHPQSIPKPAKFKWKEEDPIKREINPRTYSPADLLDIANIVWPHEFCLWLDGTLQIMLNKKELKKSSRMVSFPKKIGGLNVSFSEAFAASTQPRPPRFRFSKVASSSVSSLRSSKSQSSPQNSQSLEPTNKSGVEDSAKGPQPPNINRNAANATNGSQKEGKVDQANIQHLIAAQSSTSMNGNANYPRPIAGTTPGDPRATKPHQPCEVVVGETFELGVSCFVGVKIRDNAGSVKITVPTSAALSAACKARKKHDVLPRIMEHFKDPLGKIFIGVIGLHVWMKADPQHKIGTITRCFDTENGSLYKYSRHPDDFLYDICLVEPAAPNSFENITSPSQQWWTKVNETEPYAIVQNTKLQIVCPPANNIRSPANAIDGKSQRDFAFSLPDEPSNASYQGLRVVLHRDRGPRVKTNHGVRKVPPLVLQKSTLYRFIGPVESWERFRGAAVVQVGDKGRWDSVVGLHSFEYVGLGSDAHDMPWDGIKRGFLDGSLTFWGCRHLPEELTNMELCD